MSSPILAAFEHVHANGHCAFVPYVTAGFPDASTCLEIIRTLAENGADVIEVGLPFSDPLADGPTIQQSSRQALDRGITPGGVLELVRRAKEQIDCPVVLMTYVNPVFRMGFARFASAAKNAGVDGVIIPDLPPEEADEWLQAAQHEGLDTIFLVAPTTTRDRMELVSSLSRGFLYYVSMTGVTGSDVAVSEELLNCVREAKEVSRVPVAVGFGISTPDQAHSIAGEADGVIVGSALIRAIQAHESADAQISAVAGLASSLSSALRGVQPKAQSSGATV